MYKRQIAIIVHAGIVVVAFILNIVLVGTTWAFLLFGLYAAGVIVAKKIARIEVPFEEHKAYSYLTYPKAHASSKKLRNSWFIVLPILLITGALTSYVAIVGVVFFKEYKEIEQEERQIQNQRQRIENKEIDITPKALDQRGSHDILLYAYGYYTGLLFDKRGLRSEVFSHSEYKALALLKYLVESRDNARAKFLIGFLTGETKGRNLVQAAAEQNDEYAKIYSAVFFGCYSSNADLAVELLSKLRNTSTKEYIREEVSSILYVGLKEVCTDLEQPELALSYVVNYREK